LVGCRDKYVPKNDELEIFMQNITNVAQEPAQKIPQIAQTATDNFGKAVQNFAQNLAPIMDRLAGTQSNVRLTFEDLMLDTGTMKAKMSGSINFEVTYTEDQTGMRKQTRGSADKVDFGQVDRSVVDVE
jgi:hypothetical protein